MKALLGGDADDAVDGGKVLLCTQLRRWAISDAPVELEVILAYLQRLNNGDIDLTLGDTLSELLDVLSFVDLSTKTNKTKSQCHDLLTRLLRTFLSKTKTTGTGPLDDEYECNMQQLIDGLLSLYHGSGFHEDRVDRDRVTAELIDYWLRRDDLQARYLM